MKSQSEQHALLDASQAAPFDFDRDATSSWDANVDIEVAGMAFAFWCELEQAEVLEIVLNALPELLWRDQTLMRGWQSECHPYELQAKNAQMPVIVFARDRMDDGVIHIYEDKQALIVNLPNSALWEAHGLGWLTSCPQCCGQNIHNPAPWRGPFCECTSAS